MLSAAEKGIGCRWPLCRVVVLDHHKTSAAELTDPSTLSIQNLEVHFDMERSGATVTLDYFQPEVCLPCCRCMSPLQPLCVASHVPLLPVSLSCRCCPTCAPLGSGLEVRLG